jgi:hypothetical protein
MSETNYSYYQYQKELGYEIYLRFEDFDFENQLTDTLDVMGFNKVERDAIKDQSFNRYHTKVLNIVKASPKVSRQIDRADYVFDKYGPESLSKMGSYDVYRYKNVGMMILGDGNFLWELGLKSTNDESALRVVLTRFLSFALASRGVVGFWGVPIDEGFVVMNQKNSNSEAIFVDLKKSVIITFDGCKSIASDLQILRLDSTLNNSMKRMKPEDLLSFLSMNTTHLSYSGFEFNVKETIYELSKVALGFVYPEENFKPRLEATES